MTSPNAIFYIILGKQMLPAAQMEQMLGPWFGAAPTFY